MGRVDEVLKKLKIYSKINTWLRLLDCWKEWLLNKVNLGNGEGSGKKGPLFNWILSWNLKPTFLKWEVEENQKLKHISNQFRIEFFSKPSNYFYIFLLNMNFKNLIIRLHNFCILNMHVKFLSNQVLFITRLINLFFIHNFLP